MPQSDFVLLAVVVVMVIFLSSAIVVTKISHNPPTTMEQRFLQILIVLFLYGARVLFHLLDIK